ncbi:MAG: glycosyltransferase family 39 protein [Oligoflexia bacterium]|nr:glycosyltransferase family 39 protein [Oligoflexia bacterium]
MLKSISIKNNFNPQNINRFLETKTFFFFITFFFFAFQALSYFTLWTDTELYPVHSSQYLLTQYTYEFLFALKPLFYSLLKLSFSFSSLLDVMPMTGARFLFAFNGLAILALFYFYIKNKTNRYNAILAVLFLASLNIFLDRAFRVRSDLLSTSLSLICLLVSLNIKEQKDDWKFYVIALLLAGILLITPKGVYWLIFTSVLLWHDLKRKPSNRLIIKTVIPICLSFCLLSFIFKDPFFIETFYQSAKFYLLNLSQTYHFILQHSWFKALYELSHIGLFIERNSFLVLIIFLKFLFIIYPIIFSKNRKSNLSDLYFLSLVLITIFHPQQKLFFLSALTPFFCIAFFTDQKWNYLIKYAYSRYFKIFLLTGWLIYAFSYISYFNYKIYTKKNNLQQKNAIKELNDFYKDTDTSISILDPNCIIYLRKTHCKHLLPNKSLQDNFSSYIYNNSFDIILSPFLAPLLELLTYRRSHFEYVNIKNHIYYKAFIVDEFNRLDLIEKEKQENLNQLLKHNHPLKTSSSQQQSKKQIPAISHKQTFLSGQKIMEHFEKSDQIKVSEQFRQYFYLQIDNLNKPVRKIKDCKNKISPLLKEGCYYKKSEFIKSFIPQENKRLALFYIPFPSHLQSEKSLRILLRYDRFN